MLNLKHLFGGKPKDEDAKSGAVQLAPGAQTPGIAGAVAKLFDKNEQEVAKLRPTVERVNTLAAELKALSDEELKARSQKLRETFQEIVTQKLSRSRNAEGEAFGWQELATEMDWSDEYHRARKAAEKETLEELLPEAFALTREAGDRTIGLRHFDVQLIGGAVLHSGRIGEMRTGEGKTLVATLPTYLNALSGRGVHVVTVNDYLAERDANWMRPIYEFLGLSVAFLTNDLENDARKPAYACDVLYGTNSEFGFDYLRDNMARTSDDMVQRALNFAIVDEVDNILIDEARTPLIISAQVAKTDRALRRQQMAKTCDGLARNLMPAVTDREIENLQDSLTERGRIDIDGLMREILKNGAFDQAASYLVDSYLIGERSARVENASHLLDVAIEYSNAGLIDAAGRDHLQNIAVEAVHPDRLRDAWTQEIARLSEPFAQAFAFNMEEGNARALAMSLDLGDDASIEFAPRLDETQSKMPVVAQIVAEEMARRNLVSEGAVADVSAALLGAGNSPQAIHSALMEAVLASPGGVQEADALLHEAVAESGAIGGIKNEDSARRIIGALEEVSLRGLLPFETGERLWESVKLTQGRDALRSEIARTVEAHPGEAAQKIAQLANEYSNARQAFLQTESETLKSQLGAYEIVAKQARNGATANALRATLQSEIGKSGAFGEATKLVKNFVREQNRAHESLAGSLAEEMAQWVEVPRDANKILAQLFGEGGKTGEVRERILLAVRDLPGENTELPALIGESVRQLQEWRSEHAHLLVTEISERVELPAESSTGIVAAIENGEFAGNLEDFIGEQLLASPQIALQAQAIDEFGARLAAFEDESDTQILSSIHDVLPLSDDARDALQETLDATETDLHKAIFGTLAADAVSRHLEPLLTEENAVAFAEEVTRRLPLAKNVRKRVKANAFVGRSAEQLMRAIVRLVQETFAVVQVDEGVGEDSLKRVVRNLGWLVEKDEKRRQAALTDMGTLVAEREAGTPAFSDPENFLETLVSNEILTEDEAAVLRRAQAENPNDTISTTVDRVLRLPADRRRRLAEAKLQEIQPVLDQAVKAHALFHREVHYVIASNPETGKQEIVIVDEFTGRKMPGRRFSEGLHEALEGKHDLEVQLESQTVATVTIQNYFRLYNKLGGMTGTAKTEEAEFAKTYGIEVVSIPTNRQIKRRDFPDVVYKTAEAKFRAITFEILEHHCAGQPVLVGTRSVEVSERMSERLKAQPLQLLALQQLIKSKLWDDKSVPADQKAEIVQGLNTPIAQLNMMQVKAVARQFSINPDANHEDNINALLGLFTVANPSREKLETALKVGLPHNVLNAKNHRNEARIVAEAARPASVTIATNMAGRGVDIVLGGTLDVESRWRVMTLQTLARALENKSVQVRSRNEETTQKFVERLAPERLQDLAWMSLMTQTVDQLEREGKLQGQIAKELRDTLAQELTTPDLKNKVRSRARRLNLLDQLPLDAAPMDDNRVLDALNNDFKRLMNLSFPNEQLLMALSNGVSSRATGRDPGESALLMALSRPLSIAQNSCERLLEVLDETPDLDEMLLEAASQSADLGYAQSFLDFASQLPHVTPEWVEGELKLFNVSNAADAKRVLDLRQNTRKETNEAQILAELGEQNLGLQWLRERLREWNVASEARAFQATPELQEMLGDSAVVHLKLDKERVAALRKEWQNGGDHRRALVTVEAPNLILLGDVAEVAGHDAPFLHPEWMHATMVQLDLLTGDDVFEAQIMGQAEDEAGNLQEMPIDVLVYRIRLNRVLDALAPTLREAVQIVGSEPKDVLRELERQAPWAAQFIDENWVAGKLQSLDMTSVPVQSGAPVRIETGVAGQSADIVLEGEARAEDIAHTSEQDEVKASGGLHIIGTERHESRRIDNQLRGRAGRQGDPGSSRFYVSLEDELWRLFGVRGQGLLNKWDEDEAVEHPMISKSVERAQKKVELNHFEGRKNVLQYDDVMNVQREVIYRERRRALLGGDLRDTVLDMAQQAALSEAEKQCPRAVRSEEWDKHKLFVGLGRLFGASLLHKHLQEDELAAIANRDEIDERLMEVAEACYNARETEMGEENLRSLEAWQVTRSIDEYWMEHLAEMDYLRDAIWQEGYAQKEPIGVYRQEGFALFQKMQDEIRREVTEAVFSAQNEMSLDDFAYGGPELSELQEARLVQMMPMDDGGIEDGALLDKDADGDDDEEILVSSSPMTIPNAPNREVATQSSTRLQSGGSVSGNSFPGANNGGTNSGNQPLSRAERRARERDGKKRG